MRDPVTIKTITKTVALTLNILPSSNTNSPPLGSGDLKKIVLVKKVISVPSLKLVNSKKELILIDLLQKNQYFGLPTVHIQPMNKQR